MDIPWDKCALYGGKFIKYIFPLLLPSAFSVGIGAYLVQRFFIRRSNESQFIDRLTQSLKEVSGLSLDYWHLKPKDEDEKRTRHMIAQKLKGDLRALSADVKYYCCRYCSKEEDSINGMLLELHDACTGGSFESHDQSADESRYLVVVNTANRLRSHFYKRKL